MTINVFHSGANRQISSGYVFASGANRALQQMWVFHAGANRLLYSAAQAGVTPTSVIGTRLGAGAVTTSTPNSGFAVCSAAPAGGTYSWRRISGDSTITPTAATSSSTRFGATVSATQTKEAQFVCDYTVSGVTVTSNPVNVSLSEVS